MRGSVTKYVIKGSSRPRWRYRIDAGRDANGRRIQEGGGGFAKEGEARDAMKAHMERISARPAVTVPVETPPPAPPEKPSASGCGNGSIATLYTRAGQRPWSDTKNLPAMSEIRAFRKSLSLRTLLFRE